MQDFLQFCKVRARGDVKLGTTMQTVTEGIVSIFFHKQKNDFTRFQIIPRSFVCLFSRPDKIFAAICGKCIIILKMK